MSSSTKKSKINVGDLVALDPEAIFYTTHAHRINRVGLVTSVDDRYYRQTDETDMPEAFVGSLHWEDGEYPEEIEKNMMKVDRVSVLWASENITTYEPANCLIKVAKVKKNP
tara:strand:+ start:421 stop:756 length:336 start_codon:yes stop_codon:yes gene_type:complete